MWHRVCVRLPLPRLRVVKLTIPIRAAFCQIFDSIYLDVDMHNVKFNVNTEYAYLNNFKVLQSKRLPCPYTAAHTKHRM